MDGDLRIRQAVATDLPALVRAFGRRRDVAAWLDAADPTPGALLVAWLEAEPVGKVFVRLGPADEPEIRRLLPRVPLLHQLEVRPGRRNRGIGTALVRAAERFLAARGHTRVALGVHARNHGAVRLYERLGFANWPHQDVATIAEVVRDGRRYRIHETCRVFVKRLTPGRMCSGPPTAEC